MKILFIVTMSLLLSQVGNGQSDSVVINAFTFSPGLDYVSIKDRTFSPVVFTGMAPKISLGFCQNRRNKTLWHTSVSVSLGSIDHKNQHFSSTYASAQLSFNYLKSLRSKRKSKIYVGGQFRSALDILNYESFASGSWFTAQQLEPILLYKYIISEKQSITGQFSYPIISLVGRPGYAGVDEFVVVNSENIPKILYSKTKILSLNKLINPNFELRYAYDLAKMSFSIAANYSYLQVNSIRKYYKNELGINLEINLKLNKNNEK